MTKRRRDVLKACLGTFLTGALAGCTGLFAMGGSGQYPIHLHNVTRTDQTASVTVTNQDDDSVTVEETYELVPGESVVVGDTFKQVDKHMVEVKVETDEQSEFDFTQNAYKWNANKSLYIHIKNTGPIFSKGVSPTSPETS